MPLTRLLTHCLLVPFASPPPSVVAASWQWCLDCSLFVQKHPILWMDWAAADSLQAMVSSLSLCKSLEQCWHHWCHISDVISELWKQNRSVLKGNYKYLNTSLSPEKILLTYSLLTCSFR